MLSHDHHDETEFEMESLWERLGIRGPRSLPDCGTVDIELLRTYLITPKALDKIDQSFVFDSLMDFQEWRDEATKIAIDELKRRGLR